jgi:D-glycerate 3-kinase
MQTIDALEHAFQLARIRCGTRPLLVGIAGAQGGGKSWLARAAAKTTPGAIHLSLDDFYLSSAARRALAGTVHPLFTTRGVPGTHDLDQLNATLDALTSAGPRSETLLPAFDKLTDEPQPRQAWRRVKGRPSAIIFEGWCLGARPQRERDLATPVNALERDEDPAEIWRRAVNRRLKTDYAALFARLDAILFLQAPSFDVVHAWRCQQEETALGRTLNEAERQRIAHFIAFFERITQSMLAGRRRSDLSLELDVNRQVLCMREDGA